MARPLSLVDDYPVSIDRLQLGFQLTCTRFDRALFERGRHQLAKAGLLRQGSHPDRLEFAVLDPYSPDRNPIGTVHLTVRSGNHTSHHIVGTVRTNPIRRIRHHLGDSAGELSLAGTDNVVGATDHVEGIEGMCLAAVHDSIAAAVTTLDLLFGHDFSNDAEAELWLQVCEATRDLPVPDAPAKARRLLAAVPRGHMFVERDFYTSRVGSQLDAGAATTRVYERKTGAVLKTYAKRVELLRVECAWKSDMPCASRSSLAAWRSSPMRRWNLSGQR